MFLQNMSRAHQASRYALDMTNASNGCMKFAKIRSVEFGIPVIRVANTGVSGFFDPYGNLISKIKLNQTGVVSNNIMSRLESTLFKSWGNKIFILMLIYVCLLCTYTYTITRSKN